MTPLNGNENNNSPQFYMKAADYDAVFFILQHMRKADRIEILATEFDDDLARIAHKFTNYCDKAWVFYESGGKPVAFLGGVELWPCVMQIGFMATNEWPLVALSISRWLYKMKPIILQHYGIKQLFCFRDENHEQSEKWLNWLGFKPKGLLDDFGRNGENLVIMGLGDARDYEVTE